MSASTDYNTIAELHRLGYTANQIATRVGCSAKTVYRWRVSAGLAQPLGEFAAKPATPERIEAARRMLDEGASQRDTALTLRMSIGTLRKYFPGRVWTRQQSGQHSAMVRQLNRLETFA